MAVQMPTREQLRAVARQCGLSLDDASVDSFRALFTTYVDAYNTVAAMPDEVPRVKYPRTPGYRPGPEENKYNAWYYKSSVKGAHEGKLKGKTVVLKDNIMLAGVPMMNGAATMEGYMPDFDATIVTRILDAGGGIVGKAHCECFCLSGGSHTECHRRGAQSTQDGLLGGRLVLGQRRIGGRRRSRHGDRRRPGRFDSDAVVVLRRIRYEADVGLVPYTGIMPIEIFVDHTAR